MTKIHDVYLADLLPDVFASDELTALSYAINKAIRMLCDKADEVRSVSMIDEMPEYILDIMAVEYRAQYYDEALPLEVKRNIVKNSLSRYQKTGTAAIIKEYLKLLNGMTEVKEWYDYQGSPYHFSVYVTMPNNQPVSEQDIIDISNKIKNLKNARSMLDEVNIIKQYESIADIGIVAASSLEVRKHLGTTNTAIPVDDGILVLIDGNGRIICCEEDILIIRK